MILQFGIKGTFKNIYNKLLLCLDIKNGFQISENESIYLHSHILRLIALDEQKLLKAFKKY